MRRHRKAKIVATLGPASSDRDTIMALASAGADVFRLNFSHGTHEQHAERMAVIRSVEAELGRPIGVLLDLQGPKLRIATFAAGSVHLAVGQTFRLDQSLEPGTDARVGLPHPEIFAALKPGSELLLDDGRVKLEVVSCTPTEAETVVRTAGDLSDRKGVNVPGVVLPLSPLTTKDRQDLDFGMTLGVDWVALSFVQRPEDIEELKALVAGRALVMAKLEKPAAIERLESIVDQADGIMVARGDLGVEMPPELVPPTQRRILRVCRAKGTPVIVATQMLDSMVHAPVPTRAEASDVATAVYDGTDAVMLSAESASGQYPVEAVSMMDRIISQVERDPLHQAMLDASHSEPRGTAPDAISVALRQVAHILALPVMVTYSTSGHTACRVARERPEAPVLCVTPRATTARQLTLVWGVHAVVTKDAESVDEMTDAACLLAKSHGFAEPGQMLAIAAGLPFGTPGATNLLRIATVPG
ncbi:MAG: pyruvate kinase [Paludibacterium sp.]|uniref:pyruvate kinase n=1 Tax=Paludibacterium sp. TaxID=1917523 RepID=UPI0025F2738E|nr:pyruvate kinase [Paludibacterium sp.]MBV8046225.1 pyruvate kinase [Paludibacterium sp.]MBV8647811.1 pyruvate kinase [Paludibacterium sp.]